jgi:hypothetical protein
MWDVTRDVFHTDTRRLDLMRRVDAMNVVAPRLFGILGRACELTVLSGIASFLDEIHFPNRPDRANLVLERVIEDLGPRVGTPERIRMEIDFKRAKALAKPILESRNKVGAHNDLILNLMVANHERTGTKYPLANATVGQIDKIMRRFIRITDGIVARHGTAKIIWGDEGIETQRLFEVLKRGLSRG